ncbi:MAG TPA: hypothetical protein DEP72_03015 [Clostridiales bacterium]|nr:MAG: hypothetical protein A2Y18_04635 [Clostridiales bacterium GWD2_32_19]HCC07123.1 hypothetical protein [Clostridiales bacterium]
MSEEKGNVEDDLVLDSSISTLILHIFKPSGEELNLSNKLEVDIDKMSKHGIEFRSFFCLQKKMSFCFNLEFDEEHKMVLVAEIEDVIEEKDDYIYKCNYVHLSSMEEARIREYLGKHMVRKEG